MANHSGLQVDWDVESRLRARIGNTVLFAAAVVPAVAFGLVAMVVGLLLGLGAAVGRVRLERSLIRYGVPKIAIDLKAGTFFADRVYARYRYAKQAAPWYRPWARFIRLRTSSGSFRTWGGTNLGLVQIYGPGRASDDIQSWAPVQYHESDHHLRFVDACLGGALVALVAYVAPSWVVLVVGGPLFLVAGYIASWLRGCRFYRGAMNERSADMTRDHFVALRRVL